MSHSDLLNERRIQAKELATMAGMMNTAGLSPEEHLRVDAKYQVAMDAWDRAETDYRAAMQSLSTADLIALAAR